MKDKSGIVAYVACVFGILLIVGIILTGYQKRKEEVEKQYRSDTKYEEPKKYYKSESKSTDPEPEITEPEPEVVETTNPLYSLDGIIKSKDYIVACDRSDLEGITSEQLRNFVDNHSEYNVVFYFGNDIGMYIESGFHFAEYGKYFLSSSTFWEAYTKIDFKDDFKITNMETLEEENIGPSFDGSYIMHTKAIK